MLYAGVMRFFTSDTHFNHANILNLGVGRPFEDIDQHNMHLVGQWNSVVGPEDEVIHLGDVALGLWPEGLKFVGMGLGRKILIPGNHDRISSVESQKRRERFWDDYTEVFDEIWSEVAEITLSDGTEVLLSHYPYEGDSHDGDRFTSIRAQDEGKILLHGHNHCAPEERFSRSSRGTLQIAVGVDANDWTPVSEDQVIEWISTIEK